MPDYRPWPSSFLEEEEEVVEQETLSDLSHQLLQHYRAPARALPSLKEKKSLSASSQPQL